MTIRTKIWCIKRITLLSYTACCFLLLSCGNEHNNVSTTQQDNGELTSNFSSPIIVDTVVPVNQPISEEERLRLEGWEQANLTNGAMPNCYNYRPRYGELSNKLIVSVGGGTDVVIKMMSISSGKCVRYVFINSGSTYSIKNLPEDQYYLKIAYGRNWISKTDGGMCLGKFTSNPLYEKGEDILDFNRQEIPDGYNIPSFSLQLDVISNSSVDSFNSSGITENDFND